MHKIIALILLTLLIISCKNQTNKETVNDLDVSLLKQIEYDKYISFLKYIPETKSLIIENVVICFRLEIKMRNMF